MKRKIILLLLCSLFFLTGCVGELHSYNSLSEDEMIAYVKNKIYEDIKEEVNVEIKYKNQEYLCDAIIDGTCFGKNKIPNTFYYNLIISSKNNSEISSEDNYFTDSYKEDNRIVERNFNYKKYKENYASVKFKSEIDEILQGLIYDRKDNQVFVLSKDYEYLHYQLFTHFLNIDYDIYVIKDKELFDYLTTTTFDYRGVTQNAKNVKNTYGYARDFMEIENIEGYKYTFFRYSSNGCTGCMNGCSCSIVYGINQI